MSVRKHMHSLRRIGGRLRALRRRTKIVLTTASLAYVLLICHLVSRTFIYPNTYIGSFKASGMTKPELRAKIISFIDSPFTVAISDRRYSYTYKDMGVAIDTESLLASSFARNSAPFPIHIGSLIASLFGKTVVSVPFRYGENFHTFIRTSVYDFSEATDEVHFDDQQKILTLLENEQRYRIDEESLKILLKEKFNTPNAVLYPKLIKIPSERQEIIRNTGSRIQSIFSEPLIVLVETGQETKSFVLTERDLSDIAHVTVSEDHTSADVQLDIEGATALINERIKQTGILAHGNIASPKVLKDIEDLLVRRLDGSPTDSVTISFDKGPNSTGKLAAKYIEVDISQQKMYLFKNDKLIKEYRVSTGLEYPTPTGEFAVLNKSGLGYSRIYHVYMPYWMGFNFSTKLHAYFGIHELPYSLSGNQKIQRPPEFIGNPNTGGCVALGVGDAKAVYQFADIGTKVVIYP